MSSKSRASVGVILGLAATATVTASGALALVRKRRHHNEGSSSDSPSVVILGAGFAGLTAAWNMSEHLAGKASITLVDRQNYHLFTPMLYQVATLAADPYTVAFPVRDFTGRHHVTFRREEIAGIDLDKKQVQLSGGALGYDYLVIALGATTNFFGNQSAQEHAFSLKLLEDGIGIRNHILDMLERATVTSDAQQRRSLLTFVVVGGGATGVETAAAISTMLKSVLPADYPQLDPSEAGVILIESEGELLGDMGDKMASIALDRLRDMDVQVWLNTKAGEVDAKSVSTNDGRNVETKTVIWATGVRVPDIVSSLRAEHGKGGSLLVDDYLQVCGQPNVYAIGDCSHFEDPKSGKSAPLLAATAVQEGKAVAQNIAFALEGKPQQPFHYKDQGNVVALGRFSGVAQVRGIAVGGLIGWLAWRAVHLVKITSFRSKLSTLLDWSMGYIYIPDTARPFVEPKAGVEVSG